MTFLIIIFGTIIGSFLNVCVFRIPHKQSIAFPASHCFHCHHTLGVLDLIPLLSFIFLKGKCRYCGEKISIQYPIIELTNGIIYLFLFLKFGLGYSFIFYALFSSLLLVIAMIDFKTGIIPNKLIIFGIILGSIYLMMNWIINRSFLIIKDGILGFLAGALIILVIILISRGGMGAGDMKLMGVIGLFLGLKGVVLSLFLGILVGGIIGAVLLMTKIKDRKSAIPFGPFLALGTFVSLYWGEQIINWYLSLL
ncbi:prepilin peptidase [Defluviitalea saccharophila]|uniref:Prepilin leader peptidase/N-methyltransferase n=1 Tax=Defluviitalea saccharophila TaxID=879970 RepID=A0ABZ2Y8U4_9FIRM